VLSEGRWTHDFPIDAQRAMGLGLPVSTDLPDEVRVLMGLYPQARRAVGRRSSTSLALTRSPNAPSRPGEAPVAARPPEAT